MRLAATTAVPGPPGAQQSARGALAQELVSGLSGVALAAFMWGHLFLVGSILTGARGFDWVAGILERTGVAQPTVALVVVLFLVHAAVSARKIPARLRERRRLLALARGLRPAAALGAGAARDPRFTPHLDSLLWIWQVRTGLVMLVLGSFHVGLVGLDVLTPVFGDRAGIEAATTLARVAGGLWPLYAVLLVCVEFHASVGLFRFAIKWGGGARLGRGTLRAIESTLLAVFLGLGALVLAVLAGWLAPPLAFVLAP